MRWMTMATHMHILFKRTVLLTVPSTHTHLSFNRAHMRRPRGNRTSAKEPPPFCLTLFFLPLACQATVLEQTLNRLLWMTKFGTDLGSVTPNSSDVLVVSLLLHRWMQDRWLVIPSPSQTCGRYPSLHLSFDIKMI